MLPVSCVSSMLKGVVIVLYLRMVVCDDNQRLSCASLRPVFNETIERTPSAYALDDATENDFRTVDQIPYCFYGMLVSNGFKFVTGGNSHPPLIDVLCRDRSRRINGLYFDVFVQKDICNGDLEVFYVCCVNCTALYLRSKCKGSSCAINNFSVFMQRAYIQQSWYNTRFVAGTGERDSMEHYRSYRGFDDTDVIGPSCWDQFGRPTPSGSTAGMCSMSVSRGGDPPTFTATSDSYVGGAKRSTKAICNDVPRFKFKDGKFGSFCAFNGTALDCCCVKEDITENDSCIESLVYQGRLLCDHGNETEWGARDYARKKIYVKHREVANPKTLACRSVINLDEGGHRKHTMDTKRRAKWDESYVTRVNGGIFRDRNSIRARSYTSKDYRHRLPDGFPCFLGSGGQHLEVVMQCQHAHFCNAVDKVLMGRVLMLKNNYRVEAMCAFHRKTQFLLNNLDLAEPRYCYSHYSRKFEGKSKLVYASGNILNVYEGVNILRLDSAYDFHDGQQCKFLEVKTIPRYDKNANCSSNLPMPNTTYLPWTLFVCRCEGKFCDSKTASRINHLEKEYLKENDNYFARCLSFEGAKSCKEVEHGKISPGFGSFVCYVSAEVRSNGEMLFSGGNADADMMEKMKVQGDHLSFTMMSRVGNEGSMCRGRNMKATCVCRTTYEDWRQGRRKPCNSRLISWFHATRDAQIVTIKYHPKKTPKSSIYTSPLSGSNDRVKCYHGATSIFFSKGGKIDDEMYCNDDASTSYAEQKAFCRAEIVEDECFEYDDAQLCCCFNPKKCNSAMIKVISLIKKHWR